MTKEQIGSLLPLAIFIAFVAGCAWVVGRLTRQKVAGAKELYGTGGWLGFFLGVSFALAPLVGIAALLRNFTAAETRTPGLLELPGYVPYKAFCWCLVLGVIAWQIWMANRLRTRFEPDSVAHAKRFLAISPSSYTWAMWAPPGRSST